MESIGSRWSPTAKWILLWTQQEIEDICHVSLNPMSIGESWDRRISHVNASWRGNSSRMAVFPKRSENDQGDPAVLRDRWMMTFGFSAKPMSCRTRYDFIVVCNYKNNHFLFFCKFNWAFEERRGEDASIRLIRNNDSSVDFSNRSKDVVPFVSLSLRFSSWLFIRWHRMKRSFFVNQQGPKKDVRWQSTKQTVVVVLFFPSLPLPSPSHFSFFFSVFFFFVFVFFFFFFVVVVFSSSSPLSLLILMSPVTCTYSYVTIAALVRRRPLHTNIHTRARAPETYTHTQSEQRLNPPNSDWDISLPVMIVMFKSIDVWSFIDVAVFNVELMTKQTTSNNYLMTMVSKLVDHRDFFHFPWTIKSKMSNAKLRKNEREGERKRERGKQTSRCFSVDRQRILVLKDAKRT